MRPCDHCGEAIGAGDETCDACGKPQIWAEQLHRRRERLGLPPDENEGAPDPELLRAARVELLQSLLFGMVLAAVCGVGGWVVAGVPGAILGVAGSGLIMMALPLLASL